jgi:serine/threonine protein kinase/WD40 repeat protein
MTGRTHDERSIFLQAIEMPVPGERLSFLDAVCGENRHLRQNLEALLHAHDSPFGLLDAPDRTEMTDHRLATGERPGAVIGPYELLEKIDEGGMGVVWMAEQTHPVRRQVALKIIKPWMDSRDVIARFEAERQALAMMAHPNIASVLDAGTTESGRPYFVMELVKGKPITNYCEDSKLSLRERLELFIPVCHAVQHAHQKGIIHRDIKPSNVLVTLYDPGAPGVPKVIDFGVSKATAKKLTQGTTFTQHGLLVGTLEYMSPEQASFGSQDVDTRSDIYALGVLLYQLLTWSTPFEKEQLNALAVDDILRMIREQEPPRPSTRLRELRQSRLTDRASAFSWQARRGSPAAVATVRKSERAQQDLLIKGDLDWIVMKALEKDRNRRYQTASELALDLQRYLADEPVVACPPSLRYRLQKFVRRNRVPVFAACMVVLALIGGIIGTTWGLIHASKSKAVAEQETKRKQAALAAAQESEHEATEQLYLALLNQARAGRFSRQMGQRLDSLAALERAARIWPNDRLRDEAIAAMALPDLCKAQRSHSLPAGSTAVAYGGEYGIYARADTPEIVTVRSIVNDREIQQINAGSIPGALYFSPDERFLLGLGEGCAVRVWRLSDGREVLQSGPRECRIHAFSPDSRRLAVGQRDRVLCFDLVTGQNLMSWRLPARVHSLAFHPDNVRLAVGYRNFHVASVYDVSSGALLTDLPVGSVANHVVAWHPDGVRLAVAGADARIQIWNVAATRRVALLEGHAQPVTELSFHPEGNLLTSHGWDGQVLLWHPSSGRQLMRLTSVGEPQFSTDGRWLGLVKHGEDSDLLEVTPNREYRTLVASEGTGAPGFCYGAISPDGLVLAVGMDHGTRLWDLHSGLELATLPAWTNFVFFEGSADANATTSTPRCPRWSLLTCGSDGLLRWPLASDDPEGKRLRLGPPRKLSPLRRAWFTRNREGRTLLAVTTENGPNQILDLATGKVRQELGIHPMGEVRALSGDGRWAASCGWHSDRARLWNAVTGEMVHEWVLGKRNLVCFTPDSRSLIIARGEEFSFWDVDTLLPTLRLRREIAQFPGWVAFSPDGRLMALEMAPAVIHIKEVATGQTVAKLEDPHGDRGTWMAFTPDGTQLVVAASYVSAIHIWDLRLIRTRLRAMKLDWNWPELPSSTANDTGSEPLTIEIIPGSDAGNALTAEQWTRLTIERLRRELGANPDSVQTCNNLAWTYLAGPEALRDVKAALPLAEKAARLGAGNATVRNTLGLAYYRAGRSRKAIEVLRPHLESQESWVLAFDLYILAMSHCHLGESERARDYYDWAVRWSQLQRDLNAEHLRELLVLRGEAEELLGIGINKNRVP